MSGNWRNGLVVVTVVVAIVGCGDDDGDLSVEEEVETAETPPAVEETPAEELPVEETRPASEESETAETVVADGGTTTVATTTTVTPAAGDAGCPADAATGALLTDAQIAEAVEAAVVDRRRRQIVGFELADFDPFAAVELAREQTIEQAVRTLLIEVAGVDPLADDADPVTFVAYEQLVEHASSRFVEECAAGSTAAAANESAIVEVAAVVDATYPRAIVAVSCGQLDDRLREIADTVGATEGPAAGQLASAEEYQSYVDDLVAIGFPAGTPLAAFVEELGDDVAPQLSIAEAFRQADEAEASGDQELLATASETFFTNAQITVDEGREAAAAAEAAGLDTCVEVFTRSADEGQAALDELLAQPTG